MDTSVGRNQIDADALERALAKQASGDDHDLGLIVERLAWTPEQRLETRPSCRACRC